jgi:hypothetical protein
MIFGLGAAIFTVLTGGSVLLALGVYSLSGTLVVLALAFLAAIQADRAGPPNHQAITPAE